MSQEIEKVWPEWKVESQIGKGAFGSVYKAVRTDHGLTSTAAIKVLHIPQDDTEVNTLRSEGLDINATRTYLQGIVDDFVGEIQLMESLKGVQNIVSVEDYQVVERKDTLGWDIYIRMELLTPFDTWICSHKMSERDVLRMGVDICTALELCEKRSIIHRDIKPANIFVNDFGFFKLGDFGIARKLEATTGNLSKKGTYNYMAPEVARGAAYDGRVDIYSLGIVLYRLLNENRLPFLNSEQQLMDPNARKEALDRRLRGEPLPPPKDASPAAANLILCACAWDPDKRFRTASAMKSALHSVMGSAPERPPVSERKAPPQPAPEPPPVPAPSQPDAVADPRKGRAKERKTKHNEGRKGGMFKRFLVLLVLLVAAAGAFVLVLPRLLKEKGEDLPVIGGVISDINADSIRQENIAAALAEAEEAAQAGDYERALSVLASGLLQYPGEEQLLAKQSEYQALLDAQAKQAILDEAAEYAGAGDCKTALELIRAALEDAPADADYLEAASAYTDQLREDALAAAAQYEQAQDYASAYRTIQDALDVIGPDTELNVKASLYEQNYVAGVLAEVDALVAARDYSTARSTLTSALQVVPGNSELTARRDEIDALQPVSLSTLSALNGGWDWNNTAPEDPFGNDYSDAVNYAVFEEYGNTDYDSNLYSTNMGAYAEYRVYGNYSSLSMTLSPYKSMEQNGSAYVQIYADDVLVQTSPLITQKTDALSIEAPIEGAEYIRIVINVSYSNSDDGALIVSNVMLWP